ncbi:MAG: hypothetical protein K9N05_00350 [Candidatus Marinimicrobia bacterium]|nr:hypothetical protein [Candidatus Neomarinimicrobiota bacterium]
MDNMIFEIIGYVASIVTAISLMMKNIHRLRWWNLFGAASFSIYGAIIGAWPVFALNGFVAIVDIYYLIAMGRHKEYFDLLEIDIKTSIFTQRFINFFKEDIAKYFPAFKYKEEMNYIAYFCLRDCRPVGLVLFSAISENELLVELDYTIPQYRDMKTGKYFYHEGLKRLGIDEKKQLIIKDPNELHRKYLNAMGFKQTANENGIPIYKRTAQA